jgi:hypothetical protein
MKILQRILQYFIAAILLITGVGKLWDIPGFVKVLGTYQAFPEWGLQPIAMGFVLVELLLSGWLFWGKRLLQAALASVVLHSFFTVGVLVTLLRGVEVPNCGCFGVFFPRPLSWSTVLEDLFMLGISLTLCIIAGKERSSAE